MSGWSLPLNNKKLQRLLGIRKRVVVTPAVYPRVIEFLYVDIQSTGHTLSRPWSPQPNGVMSEIECAQLHNELFRRRHSIRQSHGLFALAKHLFTLIYAFYYQICLWLISLVDSLFMPSLIKSLFVQLNICVLFFISVNILRQFFRLKVTNLTRDITLCSSQKWL